MTNPKIEKMLAKVEHAKYVTEKLVQTTKDIAEFISEQMQVVGINEILNGKYVINELRAYEHSLLVLSLAVEDKHCNEFVVNLASNEVSSNREHSFWCDPVTGRYFLPTRHDVMTFVQDLPLIMNELANYGEDLDLKMFDEILGVMKKHNEAA